MAQAASASGRPRPPPQVKPGRVTAFVPVAQAPVLRLASTCSTSCITASGSPWPRCSSTSLFMCSPALRLISSSAGCFRVTAPPSRDGLGGAVGVEVGGGGGGGGNYSGACLHASSSTVLRHTGETETLLVTTVTEVSPPFRGVPQIWRSRSGYKSIAVSFCDQLVCSRLLATPAHPPAWLQRRIVSFLSGSSRLLSGSWYIFTLLIRHAE